LADSGKELSETLSRKVNDTLWFMDNCNMLMLAQGSQEEYLLDICAQENSACIEHKKSGHVGCCCGVNPVVSSMTVDGLASSFLDGYVSDARRLAHNTEAEVLDVCPEAWRRSRHSVMEAENRIRQYGGGKILNTYEHELNSRYTVYAEHCKQEERRRLSSDTSDASATIMPKSMDETSAPSSPAFRRATENTLGTCLPQQNADFGLKVALSNQIHSGEMCKYTEPVVTDDVVDNMCDRFCHPRIPLVVGTEAYGFSMADAESICLPPSGILDYNEEDLEKCTEWANSFSKIEHYTADFLNDVVIFGESKMLYIAATRVALEDVAEYVSTPAFRKAIDEAVDKAEVYVQHVKAKLGSKSVKDATASMKVAATKVKTSAEKLRDLVSTEVDNVKKLLSECNKFAASQGPQKEYLLDVCSQKNTACFEAEKAGHISCCCAYNPLELLGYEVLSAATIAGQKALGRRLTSSEEEPQNFDVCAESWTQSTPKVLQIREDVKKLGQEDILQERQSLLEAEYSSQGYCDVRGVRLAEFGGSSPAGTEEVGDIAAGMQPSMIVIGLALWWALL